MMGVNEVILDKSDYNERLLIGDEQEEMIAKYHDRDRFFIMNYEETVCAACVATYEGRGMLISYIENKFGDRFRRLTLGKGCSLLTVPFYEKCGFKRCGVIKNFFIDNYEHSIIEAGVQLCDMICFEKELSANGRSDIESFAS